MVMYGNELEKWKIQFKPRIKLNHNIYTRTPCSANSPKFPNMTIELFSTVQQGAGMAQR